MYYSEYLIFRYQVVQIKNIQRASKEDPHNHVEISVNGQNIVDLLEQELIALSGKRG